MVYWLCDMSNEKDNQKKKPADNCRPIVSNKKRINAEERDIDFSHQLRLLRELDERSEEINREIKAGLQALANYPKTVTIFGSARLKPDSEYYQQARKLAATLAADDNAIITGGGPGIMQAGNHGDFEATGSAIGFGIELPHEQNLNEYVTHGITFEYFFTRKLAMNFGSKAYVCFPGGFGTMDEFFQILTLVQTRKIQAVPIILFGSKFWNTIVQYSRDVRLDQFATISPEDLDLFIVTNSIEEAISIINDAEPRTDFYN